MSSTLPDAPGSAYVAVVRLTRKDRTVLALPGDRCTAVPAASLPWLHAQGLIQKAEG